MPKSSQKGGAKKEYTGTYRHFTLHEVNGKEVEIGTANIKDYQTPLNAAKKLLSSWYRHQGIKSNERNKHDIKFCIRETTRGHSKIYGPYKGKFVKYDKPLMIKLKSGKVIKRIGKPMVKLSKGNNNKKMVGGQSNDKIPITEDDLRKLVNYLNFPTKNNINKILSLEPDNKKKYENQKAINAKVDYYGKTLSNLDVSTITDMSNLFSNFDFNNAKKKGYTIDISNWKVRSVNNMESMFANSIGFNQDLNRWNIFNVENMKKMFLNCKDLDKSFSNWIIQKDTKTIGMFSGCDKYKSSFNLGFTKKIGIIRLKGNKNEATYTLNGKGLYYPSGYTVEKNSYWTSS